MGNLRIGIPRTLYFYTYFPLWKTFFEELGLDVVISPPTNKIIMDNGIKETVNDACIPVKVFHGHVMALINKVDYIFIPRLVSIDGKSTFCPKFLGLPDMVINSVDNLPAVIVEPLDLSLHRCDFPLFFLRLGKKFTYNIRRIWWAYFKGLQSWKKYKNQLLEGFRIQVKEGESAEITMVQGHNWKDGQLKLAVLAYPYVAYDPFLNINLLKKLEDMGVYLYMPDNISLKDMKKAKRRFTQDLFWYYSNQVTRACQHFLYKEPVDGIIHVTAFGCGPDSMVDKLIELEAKNAGMPFLSVTIDEHTGDVGMQTRLEAFVDMLKMRKGLFE
ncbi:MAG: 2-hydroxyglutaryl-CoA dehydratase [Firmicutes bacterium HGW-Firmicutes-13]|nr:MAG: 2-hydroxyglutaryl-CoA dehydratase [Firmicutes bacterium HGW-Firmicutes-13]